jgi:ribosomal protein S27AE
MAKVFLVKCPKCGNTMKFLPKNLDNFSEKKKKCVYCGHSFLVQKHVSESRILDVSKQNSL